jgi:hypothetical protein
MARIKSHRRRGRPRDPHARRRHTTRAGRRGVDVNDYGTEELRRRKIAMTGRPDLETSPLAILHGLGLLDAQQHEMLTIIAGWLRSYAMSWGLPTGSVGGLWAAIVAAATRGSFAPNPTNDTASGPGDTARRRLLRLRDRLNGSFELVVQLAAGEVVPEIVQRLLAGQMTAADAVTLEQLRIAVDGLSSGRRVRQGREAG